MKQQIRFDAVIFDMDGLMFDTEDLFFHVADQFMVEHGSRFTESMMAAMIGRRAEEAGKVFHTHGGLLHLRIEDIMADVKSRFFKCMLNDSNTMPGLKELLNSLDKMAVPRAVATSSGRDHAQKLIGHHGLLQHFQFLVTSEDVTRGKPDPEIYLKAAGLLNVSTSRTLVLEDSVAGLHAAKSAGAFAVGVPHRFSPASNMPHADLIIDRLDSPVLFQLLGLDQP